MKYRNNKLYRYRLTYRGLEPTLSQANTETVSWTESSTNSETWTQETSTSVTWSESS